jgi:hypothetical protein
MNLLQETCILMVFHDRTLQNYAQDMKDDSPVSKNCIASSIEVFKRGAHNMWYRHDVRTIMLVLLKLV